MATTDEEIKEKILRLLESDKEFRYTVMGLLGFSELLERFSRLEERQQRLEERQQRLEEEFKKLVERFAELEKRFAQLEERYQKLEERFAQLEERFARLEERYQKLEERQQRLEERVTRVEERLARVEEGQQQLVKAVEGLKRSLGALGRRVGMRFESLVREIYRDLLEEHGLEPLSVKRFQYVDVDGKYVARGAVIEVDIYVHDSEVWLLEVKTYVERDDVLWFYEKADIVERILGKKASRKMILAVEASRNAAEAAKSLGIELLAGEVTEE
ncbi:hypothetical protein PYJP_00280 [Pyrofollis japonicus]|uniref:PD-(D/E)XK nuclease family protein n=1 Tax=Pyrofollis japonicus TaxID=3060460 RepID=UPI00295AA902|nr:DUF3782 domain-containing protein [Pyrofollis japonicus]BEP16676.1 hypothetical protein PYJP_00280 [Pyrofollis japonicus]